MSLERLLGLVERHPGRDGVGDDRPGRQRSRSRSAADGRAIVVLGVFELLRRAGAALGQRALAGQVLLGLLARDPLLDDRRDRAIASSVTRLLSSSS